MGKARRRDKECLSAHERKFYLEDAVLERSIPEANLRQLVDLPPGLGYEEWLASHTIDFFNNINLIYGAVCEFCSLTGCPDMVGPGLRQYLWFDEKGKKARVAAPQYVDYVMTFTQNTINDEASFPTKFENDFPSSFESIVKKILRLLFHVLAHLYHAHFREVALLSLHAHLNALFAHFVLFCEHFNLVEEKELDVLSDLTDALRIHPPTSTPDPCMMAESEDTITGGSTNQESLRLDESVVTSEPQCIRLLEGVAEDGGPTRQIGQDVTIGDDVEMTSEMTSPQEGVNTFDGQQNSSYPTAMGEGLP